MTKRDYAFQYEAAGEPLEDALMIFRFETDIEAIAAAGVDFAQFNPHPKSQVTLAVSTPADLLGRWALDGDGVPVWIAEGASRGAGAATVH